MKAPTTIIVLILCALASGDCDLEAIEPKMTVSKDADPPSTILDEDSCLGMPPQLATGEPFYVYHELEEHVEPPGPLEIELETICGSTSRSVEHVQGELLKVPMSAPPGSECGLTVTATIANSSIRCDVDATKVTPCFDVSLCPSEDDTSGTESGTGG